MGKKQSKKDAERKKSFQEKCERNTSDEVTTIDVRKYSYLREPRFILIMNEEELLGIVFCSTCNPFPYSCNIDDSEYDNESTELALMGKTENNIQN